MSDRIRVAVIDDHPLFREGVAHTIRSSKSLEVVAEGACADDAIRIVKDQLPDIVLLDVSMPGGGIEAARTISRVCPVVKTIMLTVSESEEHVAQALAAGAQGYVLKGTSGPELINTMRAVSRGESYVSPGLAARLLTIAKRPPSAAAQDGDLPELTKREEGILDHVARGMTNKEIAKTLNISEKTVKHYMTNIMQKLHVRNRVEAVLAFQRKAHGAPQLDQQRGSAPPSVPRTGLSWRTVPRYQRCRTYGRAREVPSSTTASRTKIARPACASERTEKYRPPEPPANSRGSCRKKLSDSASSLVVDSVGAEGSAGKADAGWRDSREMRVADARLGAIPDCPE